MKKTARVLWVFAGLFLIASPFIRAEEPATAPTPPPGEKGDRRERRQEMRDMRENADKLYKELNLSADQQIQIDAIRKQTRESLKALRNDASLNEDQRREKGRDIFKSAADQERAVLTPEQQAKLRELREKHGRHGPGGDRPPGGAPPATAK